MSIDPYSVCASYQLTDCQSVTGLFSLKGTTATTYTRAALDPSNSPELHKSAQVGDVRIGKLQPKRTEDIK